LARRVAAVLCSFALLAVLAATVALALVWLTVVLV